MTNENETPERLYMGQIMAECDCADPMWCEANGKCRAEAVHPGYGFLSDAKDKRIEAKLARVIEVLERIANASDVYGVEANAERYGAGTLAYAHKSTCNILRATITELKGTE